MNKTKTSNTYTVLSKPREYSPNWYWQQLGYTVKNNGRSRTIYDDNGKVYCSSCGINIETYLAQQCYIRNVASVPSEYLTCTTGLESDYLYRSDKCGLSPYARQDIDLLFK